MNITTSFGQQLEVAETPNGLSVSRRNLTFNEDGSIGAERWYRDGKMHRDGGPAYIWYGSDSSFLAKSWYLDDKKHRDAGPASIQYNEDGSIWAEEWYRDGKQHRDDGPSEVEYRYGKVFPGDTRTFEELEKDGAVMYAKWHKNGKEVPRFT